MRRASQLLDLGGDDAWIRDPQSLDFTRYISACTTTAQQFFIFFHADTACKSVTVRTPRYDDGRGTVDSTRTRNTTSFFRHVRVAYRRYSALCLYGFATPAQNQPARPRGRRHCPRVGITTPNQTTVSTRPRRPAARLCRGGRAVAATSQR